MVEQKKKPTKAAKDTEDKKVEKVEKAEKVESKPNILEKLFYGLNLTWPKLIIASIVIGVFVGLLMTIPALKDTSFTRHSGAQGYFFYAHWRYSLLVGVIWHDYYYK